MSIDGAAQTNGRVSGFVQSAPPCLSHRRPRLGFLTFHETRRYIKGTGSNWLYPGTDGIYLGKGPGGLGQAGCIYPGTDGIYLGKGQGGLGQAGCIYPGTDGIYLGKGQAGCIYPGTDGIYLGKGQGGLGQPVVYTQPLMGSIWVRDREDWVRPAVYTQALMGSIWVRDREDWVSRLYIPRHWWDLSG